MAHAKKNRKIVCNIFLLIWTERLQKKKRNKIDYHKKIILRVQKWGSSLYPGYKKD